MTLKNLFVRFAKENGIFANENIKKIIKEWETKRTVYIPFNDFSWNATEEKHLFWYRKSLLWIKFLYVNNSSLDKFENCNKFEILFTMRNLIRHYALTPEHIKSEEYAEIKRLIEINKKEKNQ